MKKALIVLFTALASFAGIFAIWIDETFADHLTVRATLEDGCSINFGSGNNAIIDFGIITALSNPITQEGHFTVACSDLKGQPGSYRAASVSLNQGNIPGSTVRKRLLSNDDSTLQFQVYQGSEKTGSNVIWGDGTSGSTPSYWVDVRIGASTTYDYHVTLLAQNMKGKTTGLYQNTVIATVNYAAARR